MIGRETKSSLKLPQNSRGPRRILSGHNTVRRAPKYDPCLRPVQRHSQASELPPQTAVKIKESKVEAGRGPNDHA